MIKHNRIWFYISIFLLSARLFVDKMWKTDFWGLGVIKNPLNGDCACDWYLEIRSEEDKRNFIIYYCNIYLDKILLHVKKTPVACNRCS